MTGTSLDEPENGSWSFALEPIGDTATRLLVRGRGPSTRSPAALTFDRLIFEPAHFVMERRMMLGIKALAEGSERGRSTNHLQVLLWTTTFAIFIAAAVLALRRERWLGPLAVFVGAGISFQLESLGQPSLVVGAILVTILGVGLWWPRDRELQVARAR
jgi:hypothetical protein